MGIFEEIKWNKNDLPTQEELAGRFFMGWEKEAGQQAVPIF
ncbi:hypothetical protein [Acidaminococcus provencensis]|nr:hypothetical protein [Acidaminococcus provencensis]